jgi:hypothetical protein
MTPFSFLNLPWTARAVQKQLDPIRFPSEKADVKIGTDIILIGTGSMV